MLIALFIELYVFPVPGGPYNIVFNEAGIIILLFNMVDFEVVI